MQKVENSIVGNRQFMEAVVMDLAKHFKRHGYNPADKLEEIMYREGSAKVVDYLERKYLNG